MTIVIRGGVDQRGLLTMPHASTQPTGHVRGIQQIQLHGQDVGLALGVLGRAGRHVRHILQGVDILGKFDGDGEVTNLVHLTGDRPPGALTHLEMAGTIGYRNNLLPDLGSEGQLAPIEDGVGTQLDGGIVRNDHTSLSEGREQKGNDDERGSHDFSSFGC